MVKAEYIRKINKSSFVLMSEKDYGDERDSIEMFRHNQIPYFLSMHEQRKDTGLQFCYDITGKRSLEQMMEYKPLDYLLFQKIITSFDQACMHTENYMLTENDILLKPEFVFAESDTEQMIYCYFPGNQEDICVQFKGFMEYLLRFIDHKDERAVQLAYGVYQKVTEDGASLHHVLGNAEKMTAGRVKIQSSKNDMQRAQLWSGENDLQRVQQPQTGKDNMERVQLQTGKDNMERVQLQSDENDLERVQLRSGENGLERMQLQLGENDLERVMLQENLEIMQGRYLQPAQNELEEGDLHKNQSTMETEVIYAKQNEAEQLYAEQNLRGIRQLHAKQNIEVNMQLCANQNIKETGLIYKSQRREGQADEKEIVPKEENRVREEQVQRINKKKVKQEKKAEHPQMDSQIQKKESLINKAAEKLKKMLLKNIYTDRTRYMEEETVFEADAEEELEIRNPTVCLMPETDEIRNQFVYQGADRARDFQCVGQKIIIGSDRQESDICIPIPMISRVHARIEIGDKGTFLEDMNSTNGTHVNGELLQYRERRMLQKGDIISLAGESYSFH